jgi:predicted ATP-binding protein involved in virulence
MPDRNIVVLTAPSGAGKTTIAHRVLEAMPDMQFSVSATTRAARPDETDGVDYHFLSPEEFRARIDAGDLLEYEEVYPDQFYGTLRSEVEDRANDVSGTTPSYCSWPLRPSTSCSAGSKDVAPRTVSRFRTASTGSSRKWIGPTTAMRWS